jgi:hypothetical protein
MVKVLVVGIGVAAAMFGALGAYVAACKSRRTAEGFALGFFLGPIGAAIESLLPRGDGPFGKSSDGTARGGAALWFGVALAAVCGLAALGKTLPFALERLGPPAPEARSTAR